MPRYSSNNVIVVAKGIILENLSAQFVHAGAPQLTILYFLTRVRTEDLRKLINF